MSDVERIADLTPEEISALISAGTWYAQYHATIIAERADDGSAYAVVQREKYRNLIGALSKFGVRITDPSVAASKSARAA